MFPRRFVRRDGRVDDCSGLENRSGCKLTGGSNPSPSAWLTIECETALPTCWGGAREVDWGRLLSGYRG